MSSVVSPKQASELTLRKALHRRPLDERRLICRALEGRLVTVVDDVHRDGSLESPIDGVLVGIALTRGGTSDFVVVRNERGVLEAVSSARISRIELRS